MCVCICMCICMCMRMWIYVHICIHIYMNIRIHTYTDVHTYTQICMYTCHDSITDLAKWFSLGIKRGASIAISKGRLAPRSADPPSAPGPFPNAKSSTTGAA